ncbi:hypothetical protein RIF29_15072 [Crotalaria pallida]|uniref:Uncharacterized protein n=1 Tax=Crotalaria pallida TaxID=3830 RepID=A0AAN9FJE1_CROPI
MINEKLTLSVSLLSVSIGPLSIKLDGGPTDLKGARAKDLLQWSIQMTKSGSATRRRRRAEASNVVIDYQSQCDCHTITHRSNLSITTNLSLSFSFSAELFHSIPNPRRWQRLW